MAKGYGLNEEEIKYIFANFHKTSDYSDMLKDVIKYYKNMKYNYELISNLKKVKSVAEKINELNNLDNCDFNIATAYFSLGGFEILYPKIKKAQSQTFLGSEPRENEHKLRSLLKNERVDLNQIEISNLLARLTTDINLTSSEKSNIDNIKTFIEWIEKENVEVKILKKNFCMVKPIFQIN